MYVQSYFNEKICLEHALKLLIKVGEVHLNEVIIQRTFEEKDCSEKHYEELHNFLQRNHYKERYNKVVIDNPYKTMPSEFDAEICLVAALSFLTEIGELRGEEVAEIIMNESYRGVYKLLERGIQG